MTTAVVVWLFAFAREAQVRMYACIRSDLFEKFAFCVINESFLVVGGGKLVVQTRLAMFV